VTDPGDALNDTLVGPGEGGCVAETQVALKFSALVIWFAIDGLPTACTNIV
jgi:hypothetical protein